MSSGPAVGVATGRGDGDPGSVPLVDVQAYLELRSAIPCLLAPVRLTDAWERFYCLSHRVIHRVARASLRNEADRDDCEQDTWLDVIAHIRGFHQDPVSPRLGGWIATITLNRARYRLRERHTHPREDWGDLVFGLPGQEADPATACETREDLLSLRAALDELARSSPVSSRILHLRWFEDGSVAEVAAELGLTPEQVRSRHHRAIGKLRSILERG
ncbi:MAG: RNA polymerase sigma factor [Isosphaeraceae bacterium]